MEPVTVSHFFNPGEAALALSRLHAAGFHAELTHEMSALAMDGYSMAVGGILLQVPAEEADEAREFLKPEDSCPEAGAENSPG